MGCCENNSKNAKRDNPVDGKPFCCSIRGRRCFCLPYDDPWVIISQVLSIVAFCLSWIWWATMIIGITGLVLYQVLWCCRQRGGALYGYAAAVGVSSLASLGVGIYALIFWRGYALICEPFTFHTSMIHYDVPPPELQGLIDGSPSDFCREEVWATIAFVCAALWAGACVCLVYFVKSGRHAEWEKKHSAGCDNDNDDAVESETVGAATAAGPVFVADALMVVSKPVGNKVDDV
jgi:hypothetical protein